MQGDTIFLLVFIFIVLIAVGIIGVLYFMHVSKYDESNTFYKNLLEIIKDNPSLSNDLEDKLLDKDFSISDVSTSQRDLSNIFGAKLFNDQQVELVKDDNKAYTNEQLSNLKDTNEYRYLKDSYAVINANDRLSNIYNNSTSAYEFSSNLDLSYKFFKNDASTYIDDNTYVSMIENIDNINSSNSRYDGILGDGSVLSNLYDFYNINGTEIKFTNTKKFKINIDDLQLCNDDPSGTNVICSNLNFNKLNSSNLFN
jgi:hypothetical protein